MKYSTQIAVIDADALIALVDTDDANADAAFIQAEYLQENEFTLIYPATTIIEAATTFQRKLNKPQLAAQIMAEANVHNFIIEGVNEQTIEATAKLFQPYASKQNTPFDAVVAVIAKQHNALVFAFDSWYKKIGLTRISDIL